MIIWKKRLNSYGVSDPIIIFLLAVSVVSAIAEVVSMGMFLPLFELINQNNVENLQNSNSDISQYIYGFMSYIGLELTIEILLFLSFILFLFSKVLLYVTTYIQSYYRGLIIKNMKDKLLNNYLRVESSYYDTVGIGDFSNSSSIELSSAVSGVMLPIKLVITLVSGIGSIALLFAMSPQLTLASVCVVWIGMILPVRWVKATTKVGRKNSRYSSIVSSFLISRLQSPRLVRLSNTSDLERDSYSVITEKHRNLTLAIHLLKARISLVLEPVIIGISLLMFYIALVFLEMPVSTILLYMIVMVRIVPIVSNILIQKQGINRSIGSIQVINGLFDNMKTSAANREENILNKNLINDVGEVKALRFKNACFHYSGYTNDAISNINYTFNKSTLTAIVGPSGGGKTTFVDLISGYRRLTHGSIYINEININKYDYESFMSLVSYVPQDPQIFDKITVYDHITYGRPDSTKDEVIRASKLSGAYDFIKALPQGFDTVLMGKSSGLSGGQRQRLELSRAILRNTPILIMDEPTGNLDLVSERELMLNIKKIKTETSKIIIIIAHRVHTIIDADKIIVIEGGKISGLGTHSELLLNNSWYKSAVSEL
jgi:ABC-type multidrug transport system fused ATPase/permease subunit